MIGDPVTIGPDKKISAVILNYGRLDRRQILRHALKEIGALHAFAMLEVATIENEEFR